MIGADGSKLDCQLSMLVKSQCNNTLIRDIRIASYLIVVYVIHFHAIYRNGQEMLYRSGFLNCFSLDVHLLFSFLF